MSLTKKIGLGLLAFTASSIAMALLNEWHPTMGLGSVLYFVVCGCLITVRWIDSRTSERVPREELLK